MTNEEIVAEFAAARQWMKSNERRIDKLEEQQEEAQALVRSVDKLAQSIESMAKEQARQGKQIDALESSKSETFKYWLRTILTALCTGLIGYALAWIISK